MLELMQTGIIDHWDLWFRPMPLQCLSNIKNVYKPKNSKTSKMKNRPPALSLKNLTGAFIVLLFGFSLSFLAFLCEQILSILHRHNRRFKKTKGDKLEQEPAVNVEVEVDTQSKRIDQEEQSTDTENEFGKKSDPEMNENEATNAEIIININKTQSTKSTRKNLVVVNYEEIEIFDTELNE
jgi:hypothetical protein